MAESFLNVIRKRFGEDNYTHSFLNPTLEHGRGLPTASPRDFMFATGIECSYPTIDQGRVRRDELAECKHYECWREDLQLVKDLGLRVLRYGFPYYRTHLGPGRYDWGFTDEVMREMRHLEIVPILDLMHFGIPDWLGNYQNPELPIYFAEYAGAVAQRYPWVRFYTPINEIYITARASAKDGVWNEQLQSPPAFVRAMTNLVAACTLACERIFEHRHDAVIVTSESAEYIHEVRATPSLEITVENKLRLLSLDLLYGHPPEPEIVLYLLDNGLSRAEYSWFMRGEPPGYQIMGNDYYGHNEVIRLPDGTTCRGEDVWGWYLITRQYYERYKKPVMHTETNTYNVEDAPTWLWKQWINVQRMRADGAPVLGFTWYSLTDQVDWDSALTQKAGHVVPCGLYDLDRKPHKVAEAYRMLLHEYGQITILPHGEIFELTNRGAGIKVEV